MWWRHQIPPVPYSPAGPTFDVGFISITYNSATTDGEVRFGPREDLYDWYVFHAVPIPSTLWLLGSGLIGLIGFRRKFRKS